MHTQSNEARDLLREWVSSAIQGAQPTCYKGLAGEASDALLWSAGCLRDAETFGRVLTRCEQAAILEVETHMPNGHDLPRAWWAWYSELPPSKPQPVERFAANQWRTL